MRSKLPGGWMESP